MITHYIDFYAAKLHCLAGYVFTILCLYFAIVFLALYKPEVQLSISVSFYIS